MSTTRALATGIAVALLLTGCSSTTTGTPDDTGSDEVLAGSLIELFEGQLDTETDPFVVDVLERAVATGSIPQSDYDAAFDLYARCMDDLGYVDEARDRNKNGTIRITPPDDLDGDDFKEYFDAGGDCSEQLAPVEALFTIQQSNPDLIADPLTIATRCLAELGVTDETYDEDSLRSDLESEDPFPYDISDPDVQDCFTRANIGVSVEPR